MLHYLIYINRLVGLKHQLLAMPALRNSTTTAASPQQLHPLLLHQHTARHPSSLFSFFLFSEKKENKKKNRSSTAQPTKSCRVTTLKMPSAASNKDTTLTSPSMLAQGNWIFTPLTTARHGMIVQCTKRVRLQGGSGVRKCYHLDFHLDPTDSTRS